MSHFRRSRMLVLAAAAATLLTCEGERGPVSMKGSPGAARPPGQGSAGVTPAGERQVDPSASADCRLMGSFPCGTCDPACRTEGVLDPSEDYGEIDGLIDNPDGPGLVIGVDLIDAAYAWVSHNLVGRVSKIDLRTGACVGQFKVGRTGTEPDSPSRTTVDGQGNAYIANRGYSTIGSVTKIAGDHRHCIDKGDADTIAGNTTSTSCTSYLPLNQDECVLWTKSIPEAGVCADGSVRGIVVDFGDAFFPEGYVWVGSTCNNKFFKLRPDDGTILDTVQIDGPPYGAAIDSKGWVWSTFSGGGGGAAGAIQGFNSVTKAKTAKIYNPSTRCGTGWGYGITVDLQDRVWISSWGSPRQNPNGKPCGYDQVRGTWVAPPNPDVHCPKYRGIAIDMSGLIWTTCWDDGTIWKINPDTGDYSEIYLGCGPLGVGADLFGKVWVANADCQRITRIDPITETFETFTTGDPTAYTYSDFTGVQRALRNPRGSWVRIFERCDSTPMDRWNEIAWSITTPSNSSVTIYGKSSDDLATLDGAPQIVIADVPPAVSPLDLRAVFDRERTYLGKYLEVGVTLKASSDGLSPSFMDIYTTYNCY
jgi:hypothetical protein